MTVVLSIGASVIISIATVMGCYSMIEKEHSQVYVLSGEIPFLAEREKLETNYEMEAQAHINLFHQWFFNLPPDDTYIRYALSKAMYMADESALKQRQSLEEKGFFTNLVSSTASSSVITDSINFDPETHKFTYYATQIIKRPSKKQRRSLITTGIIKSVQRSHNNPHGLLVCQWRTLENKDLKTYD